MSEETAGVAGVSGVRFEPIGAVALKGIAAPSPISRAVRASR